MEGAEVRAFMAVEMPSSIRKRLYGLMEELHIYNARPVPEVNMHITLFFLGNIDRGRRDKLISILKGFRFGKFHASIDGIGTFSMNRPGLIFAKVGKGRSELSEMHRLLFNDVKGLGIEMDRRKYEPHATIARITHVKDSKAICEFISNNSNVHFGEFECDSIKLMQSSLEGPKRVYTELYSKSF